MLVTIAPGGQHRHGGNILESSLTEISEVPASSFLLRRSEPLDSWLLCGCLHSSTQSLGFGGKDLPRDTCRCFHNQLVLVGVYPLLDLVERLALLNLNLSRHQGLAGVNLLDHVVNHDSSLIALELSCLEVFIGSLDGVCAVVFACGPVSGLDGSRQ